MKQALLWGLIVGVGVACGGANESGNALGSGAGSGASSASGGSGASAGTIVTTNSGGTMSGGGTVSVPTGGTGGGTDSCASTNQGATSMPLDIFILLDQSGSMQENDMPWTPTTEALKGFVNNAAFAGTGVGLAYFPLGATTQADQKICTVANYVDPAVPIAELPGNASTITSSIDAHFFTSAQVDDPEHWGTPTKPAVEGTLQHLTPYAAAHPERKVVLLLATDGKPSDLCAGNDIPGIATLLSAAAAATPPIVTYVIGIGDIMNLSQLALAGGTGHDVFVVDTSANTQEEFAAALDSIRQLALPCEYPIPAPPEGAELDPTKVNVQHTADGATDGTIFAKVSASTDCLEGENNWYYDDDAAPTSIVMCPSACNQLKTGGQIDILFGCATQEAPR